MAIIHLSKGEVATVDDCYLSEVIKYSWHFDGRYAATGVKKDGKWTTMSLHQLIISLRGEIVNDGFQIDHINRNKLDDRSENLRVITPSQNAQNTNEHPNNTSGFKGIQFETSRNKWRVRVSIKGVRTNFGLYKDFDKAVRVLQNVERFIK